MDISFLMKAAGVGIMCAIICQVLSKSGRDEMSTMLSVAGIIAVFILVLAKISELVVSVKNVFGI